MKYLIALFALMIAGSGFGQASFSGSNVVVRQKLSKSKLLFERTENISGDCTCGGGTYTATVSRAGNVVTISGNFETGGTGPGSTISADGVLPEWARPVREYTSFSKFDATFDLVYIVSAQDDGDIVYQRRQFRTDTGANSFSTNNNYEFTMSYIADGI